jgi:hypothetical protein
MVMPGHQQKLVNQGFMMATDLTVYHVLEDPAFHVSAEGYIVSFVLKTWVECP